MLSAIPLPGQRPPAPRPGRRPSSSHDEITDIGLRLFAERGFDAVSVDDIAGAAGIGRRTFFRYFPSKNDVPWGRFDDHLREWERWLRAATTDLPVLDAIRIAVVRFNSVEPDQVDLHRARIRTILDSPTLQAHATLRYRRWREVISAYVAGRLGQDATDRLPHLIGHLALGAALAAYEQWLADPDADLARLLDTSLRAIAPLADAGPLDQDREMP